MGFISLVKFHLWTFALQHLGIRMQRRHVCFVYSASFLVIRTFSAATQLKVTEKMVSASTAARQYFQTAPELLHN